MGSVTSIDYFVFRDGMEVTEKSELVKGLVSEMPNYGVEHYFNIKSDMVDDKSFVLAAKLKGIYVGVIVIKEEITETGNRGVYIKALLVSERFHRLNLSYQLVCRGFSEFYDWVGYFPDHILMTTYNPITYQMMMSFSTLGDNRAFLYPDLSEKNDASKREIASEFSAVLSSEYKFKDDTGVIVNGGGEIPSSFWKVYPAVSNNKIMDYFKKNLGERDRLLCVIFCDKNHEKEIIMSNLKIEVK
jgi:hypothetical protein